MNLLTFEFMRRALLAAALVGVCAPAIGVFMVQRRLSLMGDGIGHVALTGVAVGFLTHSSPILWALVAAILGAVTIEWMRRSRSSGADLALALIFYGGIAGGVFLTTLSGTSTTGLFAYLFGSVLTVDPGELRLVGGLSVAVVAITAFFRKQLFAVCYDEDAARVAGLPVVPLNLLMAIMGAVTVVVAMRVVGLLLVAALMVIPVAAAQNVARSFSSTVNSSCLFGLGCSTLGVVVAFYADTAPGPTIVLVSLGIFAMSALVSRLRLAR